MSGEHVQRIDLEPDLLPDMKCGRDGITFVQEFRPTYFTVRWAGPAPVEVRIWGRRVLQDGSLGRRELDHRWTRSRELGSVRLADLPSPVAHQIAKCMGVRGEAPPVAEVDQHRPEHHAVLIDVKESSSQVDADPARCVSSAGLRRARGQDGVGETSGQSSLLRLVEWNVAMSLQTKTRLLAQLNPSVAVLPETAHPDKTRLGLKAIGATSVQWIGANVNKGLSVVAFGDWHVRVDDSCDPGYQWVMPLHLSGPRNIRLLAVWDMNHRGSGHQSARRGLLHDQVTVSVTRPDWPVGS